MATHKHQWRRLVAATTTGTSYGWIQIMIYPPSSTSEWVGFDIGAIFWLFSLYFWYQCVLCNNLCIVMNIRLSLLKVFLTQTHALYHNFFIFWIVQENFIDFGTLKILTGQGGKPHHNSEEASQQSWQPTTRQSHAPSNPTKAIGWKDSNQEQNKAH